MVIIHKGEKLAVKSVLCKDEGVCGSLSSNYINSAQLKSCGVTKRYNGNPIRVNLSLDDY